MRKSVAFPVLALVLGVAAAALRLWQRTAGYDASGLPVATSLPSMVLTAFLLACAGLFLAVGLRQPAKLTEQGPTNPMGSTFALLFAAAGVLVLVSGVLNLKTAFDGFLVYSEGMYMDESTRKEALRLFLLSNLLPLVVGIAAIPAAAALFFRAKQAKAGLPAVLDEESEEEEEKSSGVFPVLAPSLFCWLWLIEAYRQNTSNPILWEYVLLLLAVVVLLLAGYDRAGFPLGVGKPRRTVFLSLLALFLAAAALPDSRNLANAAALLGLALQTLAELTPILQASEDAPDEPETEEKSIQ